MKVLLTGHKGFIGSNLLTKLKELGHYVYCLEKDGNYEELALEQMIERCDVIFHVGAISDTTLQDANEMLYYNYTLSKRIFDLARKHNIKVVYSSSAANYGSGDGIPNNIYGWSKLLAEEYGLKTCERFVALRYFNVYGPQEQHKGNMASVAYHLHNQLKESDEIKLFEGSDGYDDGEQRRDFIYVEDVVKVNLWFLKNKNISGIFNLGTGKSQTFNEIAEAVIDWNKKGKVKYIKFPENLKEAYQSFTEANISKLREAGYEEEFVNVKEGVKLYLDNLEGWPKNDHT